MIINNPNVLNRFLTDSGEILKCKSFDIPAWNMDTTPGMEILHTLGSAWSKVIGYFAMIYDDAGDNAFPLDGYDETTLKWGGGIAWINSSNITLVRRGNGRFDNIAFDSVASPRGRLTLWYVE